MSTWVGISPVIGAGSLEGFAVGATAAGALFLAIAAPRRLRRRPAAAAGAHGAPVSASSAEAEAFDVGPFGAGWTSPTGRGGRADAYRSRHRLGDPIPDGAMPDTSFPDVALPGVPFTDVAFPGGLFRSPRRPVVRRLPRHAAPTVSFGTKVSGRVTGLFAAWPLAGGAPS
jgi:hypothetical protein